VVESSCGAARVELHQPLPFDDSAIAELAEEFLGEAVDDAGIGLRELVISLFGAVAQRLNNVWDYRGR